MKTVTFALLGSMVMFGLLAVPRARASEWNEANYLTVISFNHPVEIPGRVLTAGTYQFKVADAFNDHDVIEIYNAHGTKLVDIADAIPVQRSKATSHVVVTFEERAANAPAAVRTWYDPGRKLGQQFVYQPAGKTNS